MAAAAPNSGMPFLCDILLLEDGSLRWATTTDDDSDAGVMLRVRPSDPEWYQWMRQLREDPTPPHES